MARKTVERKVTFSERDLPGFLDMLRYDGCTVVGWSGGIDGKASTYTVVLRSSPDRTPGYEFTPDRWASFGLYLKERHA